MTMPLAQQAGYYCNVCDCILKDSKSYLDHINGEEAACVCWRRRCPPSSCALLMRPLP